MNTRLILENREIELDETVQFAITKQFEDLSNPTTIINDWSKTVSIPFTARNNAIFGHIYNPDKLTVEGGSNQTFTGIYFNPLKKLDMRLQWGDDVLMTGYAKMNEVKQNNGKGTYELTLFGQLGKVFQEMQKITFDKTVNDTSYLIDGAKYVDDYIDRTLVYNSWNSTGQTHSELLEKTDSGYTVTDIIGFAPNNAFSEEFDYKTFQLSSSSSTTWEDYLGDSFTQDTGIQPSTIIPNGLLPREVGEYRSYLQLPFIYWNKLFKIYQAKAEQLTGYQFDLDSEWFTTANPYWHNLVYMLKPLNFSNKDATALVNRYKTTDDIYSWVPTENPIYANSQIAYYYYTWDGTETTNVNTFAEKSETTPIYVSGNTFQIDDSTMLSNDGSFNVRFSTTSDKKDLGLKFNTLCQAFVIELKFTGVNTGNVITKKIVFAGANPNEEWIVNLKNSADSVCIVPESNANSYYDSNLDKYVYYIDCIAPLPKFPVSAAGLDTEFKISYTAAWGAFILSIDNHLKLSPFIKRAKTPHGYVHVIHLGTYDTDIVLNLNMSVRRGIFHSGSKFNLNDLWNKEFKLFDEIIKYCKIYRINITVDDFNKKIVFRRLPRYFRDYKVLDWTNKIDKSKDYTIKPLTFENKYVLFNYKDSKIAIGEEYKKRYGVNYGDYRLITDYNFNDSKTELFKDISQSIVSSDNVLSWLTLLRHKVAYTMGTEIFVNNRDKDKKQVDIFGSYFFHNGAAIFDVGNGSELAGVTISDDSDLQGKNSTFFYSYIQSDRVYTVSYPKLDIVTDNYMCIFNKPKENFTYLANYDNKKTIYDNFWYDYINERYNIQNKLITCYVYLKPTDYINFDFNNLIRVGNQLCLVNKIYDYDVSSTVPTKVDLVTIQDIGGYTNDDFITGIDVIGLSWNTQHYLNGETGTTQQLGTFTSITDVTFANGSKTYNSGGVKFTISGNTVYYQCVSRYVDKEDLNMNIILKNEHNTASFNIVRYSTYPYPWIIIEDSGGNEVSSINQGSRVYKLKWHGTETEGLDNKPTIVIENHGTGSATIGNDWVENQVIIQEGINEYHRNEYEVTLNTNMTYNSGTYIRFIVTDKAGWHETRDYPISL